jgi:DUF4097 and DUF4098 domain-containing protein YvlB
MLYRLGLLAAIVLGCASAAAAETKNIDRTLPLSATGTVEIEAHNGRIDVRTWDRPEVEVHVRIDWPGLSSSSYRFRDTTVNVEGSSDRVTIKWYSPDQYGWGLWSLFDGGWIGPEVHYSITAPRNARLDIRNHNANTDIRDVNAAVHLGTHNGMVRVTNLAGPLDLSMHNGWARVDFASFTQDSRITTHNGVVELALPASSKFDFDSRGHHVRVDSDFQPATHAVVYGRHDGNVSGTINGGGPDLRFVAHNGSIRIRKK